jgi:O-antigen/teichoic acid export membrane protein
MGPVSITITLATAVVLMTSPTWFVTGIHGARFAAAAPLVLILVPAGLVGGLGNLWLQELLGRGAPRVTWLAPAAALVVSAVGNAIAVPRWGATGTAWVALASALVLAAVAGAGVIAARRRDEDRASSGPPPRESL